MNGCSLFSWNSFQCPSLLSARADNLGRLMHLVSQCNVCLGKTYSFVMLLCGFREIMQSLIFYF